MVALPDTAGLYWIDRRIAISDISFDIVLTAMRPRRLSRHLTNDPFQLVTLALPLHGSTRQVSTKRAELRGEIAVRVHELAQSSFRKSDNQIAYATKTRFDV